MNEKKDTWIKVWIDGIDNDDYFGAYVDTDVWDTLTPEQRAQCIEQYSHAERAYVHRYVIYASSVGKFETSYSFKEALDLTVAEISDCFEHKWMANGYCSEEEAVSRDAALAEMFTQGLLAAGVEV